MAADERLDLAIGHAWRIEVHEEPGDALVARRRIGLRVDDRVVGARRVRRPGLRAVEHPAVAVAPGARRDRREVAAGAGLGQAHRSHRGAGEQPGQPAFALRRRAVARDTRGGVVGVDPGEGERHVVPGEGFHHPHLDRVGQVVAALVRGHLDAVEAERRRGGERLARPLAIVLPLLRAPGDDVLGKGFGAGDEGLRLDLGGGPGTGHGRWTGRHCSSASRRLRNDCREPLYWHEREARADRPATTGDTTMKDALARMLAYHREARHCPGALVLVERDGVEAARLVAGTMRGEAGSEPMRPDALFRIASRTKPVVSVLALTLVDEGRLGLDDAVARHLPELDGMRLLDGSAPVRAPTIRDLMRHTAGLPYGGETRDPRALERVRAERLDGRLPLLEPARFLESLARLPLANQPGAS